MKSWSNHLEKGTATLYQPPAVAHFDVSQRIKIMPRTPPEIPTPPTVPGPSISLAPVPPPLPPSGVLGSSLQLTDLLAFGLVSQMMGSNGLGNNLMAAFPAFANNTTTTNEGKATSTAPPPSLPPSLSNTLNVAVPLTNFCERYHLSAETQTSLAKLGYVPGDSNLCHTSEAHWRDFAGIPPLVWARVLDSH
ncbi:hypothetical protein K435DRAFT_843327 [Dendrothele bispora CBS 962.96]|uniref:Uncharacterized protein n=1 Tax=Dendrothele bispora (strain CBS 962.96) TaxID=1314807 RepID=A0A4S8L974_DENBC|nr:hypothetical protein K435DRAFT_843327 [Dendrothele bispora CBS 962.96]